MSEAAKILDFDIPEKSIQTADIAPHNVLLSSGSRAWGYPIYVRVGDPSEDIKHPDKEALKEEIDRVLEYAGKKNWDGEDALPITTKVVKLAHEVISQFPFGRIAMPDVVATPHGEIDFDWVLEQNTMLTVSAAPGNIVAFAGTFPVADITGKEKWTGELPHFLNCCFELLEGHDS